MFVFANAGRAGAAAFVEPRDGAAAPMALAAFLASDDAIYVTVIELFAHGDVAQV
jgi:hypothetical protein